MINSPERGRTADAGSKGRHVTATPQGPIVHTGNLLFYLRVCFLHVGSLSLFLLRCFLDFRPGVTQFNSSVQNRFVLSCLRINAEVPQAFKLKSIKRLEGTHRRFYSTFMKDVERMRVEKFFEIRFFLPSRVNNSKKPVVQSYLGRDGMRS